MLSVVPQISVACAFTYFQAESESGDVMIIPSSDPASNLQPAKPTDFIAFINLVEFCRYCIFKINLRIRKHVLGTVGAMQN